MQDRLHTALAGVSRTSVGYEGVISALGRDVKISIDLDGCTEQATLDLAVEVVAHLPLLDEKCRNLIADEFLASYNDNWRIGEVLGRHEFCERLELSSVGITGDQTSDIWYECGNLFGGHSLYVTAFDGHSFDDTHVQMFG